jgi:hypothetical protein
MSWTWQEGSTSLIDGHGKSEGSGVEGTVGAKSKRTKTTWSKRLKKVWAR